MAYRHYIYNFDDVKLFFNDMMKVWNEELLKHNLKIKVVITENTFPKNHNITLGNLEKFTFEPMYSTNYAKLTTYNFMKMIRTGKINKGNFDVDYYLEKNPDLKDIGDLYEHYVKYGSAEYRFFRLNDDTHVDRHIQINYEDIIYNYTHKYTVVNNKHLGLPLYWNNIVRRKEINFLCVKNFTQANLEKMLMILLSKIVLRYKNIYELDDIKITKKENIINVNAWNEWNEQAILEPNDITGYANLETIHNIIKNL